MIRIPRCRARTAHPIYVSKSYSKFQAVHSPEWSAVTSICSSGKREKFCLHWSRCGTASHSQALPLHSRSGGASPAPCPMSSGDHSRGQPDHKLGLFCKISQCTVGPTKMKKMAMQITNRRRLTLHGQAFETFLLYQIQMTYSLGGMFLDIIPWREYF